MRYKIKAKLWLWGGGEKGSWHFASIPPEIASIISEKYKNLKKGWGSFPVKVYFVSPENKKKKIILETSIFPNKKDRIFILPIKKKIRQELGIQDGDIIDFELKVKK